MVIRAAGPSSRSASCRSLPPARRRTKLSSFRDGWATAPSCSCLPHARSWSRAALRRSASDRRDLDLQPGDLGREWQLHSMIGGSLLGIVGVQVLASGCARTPTGYFRGSASRGSTACARAKYRLEHGSLGARDPLRRSRDPRDDRVHMGQQRLRGTLRGAACSWPGRTLIIVGLQIVFRRSCSRSRRAGGTRASCARSQPAAALTSMRPICRSASISRIGSGPRCRSGPRSARGSRLERLDSLGPRARCCRARRPRRELTSRPDVRPRSRGASPVGLDRHDHTTRGRRCGGRGGEWKAARGAGGSDRWRGRGARLAAKRVMPSRTAMITSSRRPSTQPRVEVA